MFRILAFFFRFADNLSLSQSRGNERLSTKRPTLKSILLAFWQFLRKLSDIAIHCHFAVYDVAVAAAAAIAAVFAAATAAV